MSSPRVQKYFEAMPNQIIRLGGYQADFNEALRWQGRVGADTAAVDVAEGEDAAVVDITALAWATLNKRFLIVAKRASDANDTKALQTQSHAFGQVIDGSHSFYVFAEAPASPGGASDANLEYYRFTQIIQQHLTGQLGAPVKFYWTDAGVEPTLEGVSGAGSSASFTEGDWVIPYGLTYPGGV